MSLTVSQRPTAGRRRAADDCGDCGDCGECWSGAGHMTRLRPSTSVWML